MSHQVVDALGTINAINWTVKNIIPLLILGIAALVAIKGGAHKDLKAAMEMVIGVMIGLMLAALAVDGNPLAVGAFVWGLFQ